MTSQSVGSAPPITPPALAIIDAAFDPPPESLLPEPQQSGAELEAMSALYALMAEQHRVAKRGAVSDANQRLEQKRDFRARAIEQLKQAEADKEDGGMFGEIGKKLGTAGKIAAIAGAAALVVATGGAGLVGVLAIGGVLLSSAAFAQSETRFLQKLGMDDKTAFYTELGLLGAGALCSGGAGLAAVAGAGTSAAATATTVQKSAHLVGAGTSITSGACTAGSAYAGWQRGNCEADASEHLASAAAEHAKEARMQRMLLQLIDEIEDCEKSDQRTLGHLRGAIEAKGAALVMASGRV